MPQPIIVDTNLIIEHIRQNKNLPAETVIPMVVVGELEAFALKANWGPAKVALMRHLFDFHALFEISRILTEPYARIDAYSQGKLPTQPLPPGMSARNMGKNDLWIAATALYFDVELHTRDRDFNHLIPLGLKLVRS